MVAVDDMGRLWVEDDGLWSSMMAITNFLKGNHTVQLGIVIQSCSYSNKYCIMHCPHPESGLKSYFELACTTCQWVIIMLSLPLKRSCCPLAPAIFPSEDSANVRVTYGWARLLLYGWRTDARNSIKSHDPTQMTSDQLADEVDEDGQIETLQTESKKKKPKKKKPKKKVEQSDPPRIGLSKFYTDGIYPQVSPWNSEWLLTVGQGEIQEYKNEHVVFLPASPILTGPQQHVQDHWRGKETSGEACRWRSRKDVSKHQACSSGSPTGSPTCPETHQAWHDYGGDSRKHRRRNQSIGRGGMKTQSARRK